MRGPHYLVTIEEQRAGEDSTLAMVKRYRHVLPGLTVAAASGWTASSSWARSERPRLAMR